MVAVPQVVVAGAEAPQIHVQPPPSHLGGQQVRGRDDPVGPVQVVYEEDDPGQRGRVGRVLTGHGTSLDCDLVVTEL